MFISKFSSEDWQNNQNNEVLHPAKNWQEIEKVIRELDGKHRTLVILETDGEAHLSIGGGPDKFIVYLTFDNETFYHLLNRAYLLDPSKSKSKENIIVGGQAGLYATKLCVGMDTAIQVAETFAQFGEKDRSYIWKKEGISKPKVYNPNFKKDKNVNLKKLNLTRLYRTYHASNR